MLDTVNVDYYGTPTPLNQVCHGSCRGSIAHCGRPGTLLKLQAIEKAIRSAELGLNPMNDGKIIRVAVPALTEERRKDMVKRSAEKGYHATTIADIVKAAGPTNPKTPSSATS